MELKSALQSIMEQQEKRFTRSTHERIMRHIRVTLPLQRWGVRAYLVLTASLAAFSLWNAVTFMIDRKAFEFVSLALEGLMLDVSVWPYFSSVFFDFVPSGWSIAFVANGILLLAGLFALRRGGRTTHFFSS